MAVTLALILILGTIDFLVETFYTYPYDYLMNIDDDKEFYDELYEGLSFRDEFPMFLYAVYKIVYAVLFIFLTLLLFVLVFITLLD